jgi:hypothetical protein
VTQLGFAGRGLISIVKDFMEINQIEKFDQRQKPAKWTQLLATGLIGRGSIDFSGLSAIFTKPFTNTVFAGNVFMVRENLCYYRNPKWFFIFQDLFGAKLRY